MGRKLPPFAAVKAFEAAARHLSFSEAANELCLSPSAISHQIRSLEAYLDTRLFERVGNNVRLTLTGQAYSGQMTTLLD
jgi:LysR family glycine cleavage system transcriptional activator